MFVLSPLNSKSVYPGLDVLTWMFLKHQNSLCLSYPICLLWHGITLSSSVSLFPLTPHTASWLPPSAESASFIFCDLSTCAIPHPLISMGPLRLSPFGWWHCPLACCLFLSKPKSVPVFSNARLALVPESPRSSKHAEFWVHLTHSGFPFPGVGSRNLHLPCSLNLRTPLV